jgi:LysM repeat protein
MKKIVLSGVVLVTVAVVLNAEEAAQMPQNSESIVQEEITADSPSVQKAGSDAETVVAEQGGKESSHMVVKGDTLWDLAGAYYENNWKWQLIWKANKDMVKNPNLIFPDQNLIIPENAEVREKIRPEDVMPVEKVEVIEEIEEPEAEAVEEEIIEKEPVKKAEKEEEAEEENNFIKGESFIADMGWKPDGSIIGDKDRKLLISAGDTVYVKLSQGKPEPGEKYIIYRQVTRVKDRDTKDYIGYEIREVGSLEITDKAGKNSSTAKIMVSAEPVKIGDLIKTGE